LTTSPDVGWVGFLVVVGVELPLGDAARGPTTAVTVARLRT
jgi:hypothetical protein